MSRTSPRNSTIVPQVSWPGMNGLSIGGKCPCQRCASVPHSVAASTRISAEPGSSSGIGTRPDLEFVVQRGDHRGFAFHGRDAWRRTKKDPRSASPRKRRPFGVSERSAFLTYERERTGVLCARTADVIRCGALGFAAAIPRQLVLHDRRAGDGCHLHRSPARRGESSAEMTSCERLSWPP